MKNIYTLKHPLQQHIITLLSRQEFARFKDLSPIKTDTNVMAYHIKTLLKLDIIKKQNDVYTISQNGIIYINNLTKSDTNLPLVKCVVLLQNSEGDILLTRQLHQPYINTLSLPMRYVEVEDQSINTTARHIVAEQIGLKGANIAHVGDAYVRVKVGEPISTTLVHVFRVMSDDVAMSTQFTWVQPHKLSAMRLTPGTESIIARSFFGDAHFFEEYEDTWYS